MTFSTLQTLTTNNNNNILPVAESYTPGDDASVANHLAEYYKAKGIDPARAYDNPDDAIADFGGPQAFI